MENYDVYLFDWDGTLAQTLDSWLKLMREIFASHGIHADDKAIVHKTFGRVRQGALDLGVPADKVATLIEELTRQAPDRVSRAPLYPGVRAMLQALHKQGKQLAVITTTYRQIIDVVLAEHRLLELFDLVITGDDVKTHKPDPEGILYAVQTFGAPKDRVVMLGDSDKDLGAASNAGIDSLLYYPPSHDVFYDLPQLLACRPTFQIAAWRELTDRLQ